MKFQFFSASLVCLVLFGCGAGEEKKAEAPTGDILSIAQRTGFEILPENKQEKGFLEFILPEGERTALRTVTLLWEGDRVAALSFVQSPKSAAHFLTLKERTFVLFSKNMTNLIDERVERPGLAPFDILAFTDPILGEERFLFALVRDTLYEFHVAPEKENIVQGLVLEAARSAH